VGRILSVNLAVPEASSAKGVGVTGINKCPVKGPVLVRPPGPKTVGLGSGVVGDQILDAVHHGGDDQAVYVYAREDYDRWEAELGRSLREGLFGDNLTTVGADVNGAVIGERWRVGADLVLQATYGRIPCATFQAKMPEPQWVRRFTQDARPGAYFRVVVAGEVCAGDEIAVLHRPSHAVTVAELFRAWTLESELLPRLLPRLLRDDDVPESLKDKARRRLGR
jgi:MOSC domain-containing protein YiiM